MKSSLCGLLFGAVVLLGGAATAQSHCTGNCSGVCAGFVSTSCTAANGCSGSTVCLTQNQFPYYAGQEVCYTPSGSLGCTECGAGGYRQCRGYGGTAPCRPSVTRAESCNLCDDNANGQVDEGLSGLACTTATSCSGATQCTSGVLSCNLTGSSARSCSACAGGTQTCNTNGTFGTCQPQMASAELCNNCDDDKNGLVDDQVGTQPCTMLNGCNGLTQCNAGVSSCGLILLPPFGSSASTRPCSTCGPAGSQVCLASGLFGPCRPESSRPEACNGCDDDWDTLVDEDVAGNALQQVCTWLSRCSYQACTNGMWGQCSSPPQEVCNGEDDNCDDQIDEGGVCRAPTNCACQPVSCTSVGAQCGVIPDGCGAQLDCGTCGSGLRCIANACVL